MGVNDIEVVLDFLEQRVGPVVLGEVHDGAHFVRNVRPIPGHHGPPDGGVENEKWTREDGLTTF